MSTIVSDRIQKSRSYRKTTMDTVFDVVNTILLLLVLAITILPFLNLFSISLSNDAAVLSGSVSIYPKGFNVTAYVELFSSPAVGRAFLNSVLVAGAGCVSSIVLSVLAAYPMAFSNFIGKRVYTFFVLLPMWFSAGIVPTYMVVKSLGLVDSFAALILVALISPYNLIILSSYMRSIPKELVESSRIDGATDFRILFQIVVPLSKATIATIALWVVVGHWNDFMSPLMYLTDFKKFTLQLVLRDIVLSASTAMYELSSAAGKEGGVAGLPEKMKYAMLGVSILPMLCFYPFIQKYFVSGIMLGSVKG